MVSVVIPNYNYARFLDEAVLSVLNQTYIDFELIISDNASTDNSVEVARKYLSDPRVQLHQNEVNLGQSGNLNKCIGLARGKYIKFLCADDKFEPDMLQKFVQVMEEHSGVSVVTSNQYLFGGQTGVVDLPYSGLQPGKKILKETILSNNFIGGPTSIMVRASNKVGKFRTDFKWLPDWEMWLRHLAVGDCFFIPERLIYNRLHSNQVTVQVNKNYIARFEEYQFFKEIYEGKLYGITGPEIKKIVKAKAANCAGVAYRTLPHIVDKTSRSLFRKAVAIAFSENVVLQPILQMW